MTSSPDRFTRWTQQVAALNRHHVTLQDAHGNAPDACLESGRIFRIRLSPDEAHLFRSECALPILPGLNWLR